MFISLCVLLPVVNLNNGISHYIAVYTQEDTLLYIVALISSLLQMSMSVRMVLHHVIQILTVSTLLVVMTVFADMAILGMEGFPVQVYIHSS